MTRTDRRVVITGMGIVSPLGNSTAELWDSLCEGKSGVNFLTRVPTQHLPSPIGGEATQFTGSIEDFGELQNALRRTIKKGLKLMCRDIAMGVAAAQLALRHGGLQDADTRDPDRIGTLFGTDYIITEPAEFTSGIQRCLNQDGEFDFGKWAENGLGQVEPLWLLKYLPNMPASHVAIYNDLRGPSNSLTMREASPNLAIAEAATIIRRGNVDQMVTGSTGSRIHMLRTLHVSLQEQLATCDVDGGDPAQASRPFDKDRTGMVLGEGAGCVLLEELETARNRGAKILGEVVGYASSSVASVRGVADYESAFGNVLSLAIESAGLHPSDIGHVNAHGLSTMRCDREEARAINEVCGHQTPVVALKGAMGNLGAGSGMVELVASVLAMENDRLFSTLNYEIADPDCPINVTTSSDVAPGDRFVNLSITPQGQASAVVVQRL